MFGLLYARQSCTNQPPGSDAVAVLLALARPTTEWHHTFRVADSIHASQHRSVADSSGGCNTRGLSGLPWSRCRLLRLSRGVEQFDDLLAWFHEPEGFAWPVVEFLGDRVEVVLRVDG